MLFGRKKEAPKSVTLPPEIAPSSYNELPVQQPIQPVQSPQQPEVQPQPVQTEPKLKDYFFVVSAEALPTGEFSYVVISDKLLNLGFQN